MTTSAPPRTNGPLVASNESKRPDRVGHMVQQELANLLVNEVKDPRVGFVTVTEVRMSPDLRNANVFVSILGPDEQRAQSMEGLRAATGYLRREVGKRLKLRFIPELAFSNDTSLDQAARLEQVFSAIKRGEADAPEGEFEPLVEAETIRSEMQEVARRVEEDAQRLATSPPQRSGRRKKRRR